MIQRAGGDHTNPRAHDPPWASVEVSDALLGEFAPWFVEIEPRVTAAYTAATCAREKQEGRLYSARGACSAVRFMLETALKAAAARPLDENSVLCAADEPLYLQFNNDLFRLNGAFASPLFFDLHARVRAAEDAAYAALASGTAAVATLASPITQRIDAVVVRHTAPLVRGQATLLEAARSLLARFDEAAAASGLCLQPSSSPPPLQQAPRRFDAALAVAPKPATAAREDEATPLKKRRLSRASHAATGQFVQSDQLKTVRGLWREWDTGINAPPSVRELEAGFPANNWRSYGGAKQVYHKRKVLYEIIENAADREATIVKLQARLDARPKKGRSPHPDVAGFLVLLTKEQVADRATAAAAPAI